MIQFQNTIGQIFICDFSGYRLPEIVKRRPVIAISPPEAHHTSLVTVVPLSTTEPRPVRPYHVFIDRVPVMQHFDKGYAWAKCDLIYTVSFDRLFLPEFGKNAAGRRKYLTYRFDDDVMDQIFRAVQASLGLL